MMHCFASNERMDTTSFLNAFFYWVGENISQVTRFPKTEPVPVVLTFMSIHTTGKLSIFASGSAICFVNEDC